jgi:hypothetical protein
MADADQRHPQLGRGLLLLLKLPVTLSKPAADHLALELNTAEANTFAGSHLLGGWCSQKLSSDRQLPVFASFVPNAVYRPGLVPTLVMNLVQKARWARSQIAPYAADIGLPIYFKATRGMGDGLRVHPKCNQSALTSYRYLPAQLTYPSCGNTRWLTLWGRTMSSATGSTLESGMSHSAIKK